MDEIVFVQAALDRRGLRSVGGCLGVDQMTYSNFLQWAGSVLVLLSYVAYQHGGFAAPVLGVAASTMLVAWTIEARAWGYFTLNVSLVAINLWTAYEWSVNESIVRSFWTQVGGTL